MHDQGILFSLGKSEDIPVEETRWPESETSKDAPQSPAIFATVPKRPQTKQGKKWQQHRAGADFVRAHLQHIKSHPSHATLSKQ